MIYFDHNATTPLDERVVEAMLPYLTTFHGNPSSLYKIGRLARSAINTAREQVAALVGVSATQIIFTSGGTEANNLALNTLEKPGLLAVSAIEHPSIMEAAKSIASDCLKIAVDSHGQLQLAALETLFQQTSTPALVSVMLANNETGVIQDIRTIADLVNDTQALFHTDAVQAIGQIPVSFPDLGVDLMSLSSHKIYGPKGSGALVFNKNINPKPLLIGGGEENGWRAGTENVAAIVGFGKAAELALLELDQQAEHSLKLTQQLEQELKALPNVFIFSAKAKRMPNTVQFGVKGMDGEMLLMQLDQKNIAVSSGSACSSGGGKASDVLTAMGIDYPLAKSAIRVSVGKDNSKADVKQFINVLKSFITKD